MKATVTVSLKKSSDFGFCTTHFISSSALFVFQLIVSIERKKIFPKKTTCSWGWKADGQDKKSTFENKSAEVWDNRVKCVGKSCSQVLYYP